MLPVVAGLWFNLPKDSASACGACATVQRLCLTVPWCSACSWREVDISALKVNPEEDNEEVRGVLAPG